MKLVRRTQPFIGLALLLLMMQCQNVTTQPPKAEGFDPLIPATISYLAGPITFDLEELQKKINQELDPVLVGKQTSEGKSKSIISFRVKRLGDVQVQYVDHQIKLSAPLQMWLTKPFSHDTTPPKKALLFAACRFQNADSCNTQLATSQPYYVCRLSLDHKA